MDFLKGTELLQLCEENHLPISGVMLQREIDHTPLSRAEIWKKLKEALHIMKCAAQTPLQHPKPSMGGLIGGEAQKLYRHMDTADCIAGNTLSRAVCYSMAVLEVNASMGTIVAAPTAGSSGVLPGVLLALQDTRDFSEEQLCHGLLCAGAVGCLLMMNSSVSGAEAGCQAEVGSASAMAAAAAVELLGGTPEMCLTAASFALSNLLGLVCDPIAGLVESPCQSRNAIGVANAITCAELALSGLSCPIPFDEMAEAMKHIGSCMPTELRETALGGCAATPSGQQLCSRTGKGSCQNCR